MQKPVPKYLTPEEYLVREEIATHKSEYYQGEIFAMAGNTIDHNRIVRNLTEQLNRSFENKNCEAFNENVRLCIDTMQFFAYPDILVVRGKIEFYENRRDTLLNPILIVEVLSDSTENYDRGQKFKFYRSVPTMREYLLIDQYKIRLEQFSLGQQGKWMLSDYDGAEAILYCTSIDFQIPLREIYHRVEFERAEGRGPRG
ncbi:MAG: Uma2 family endonuclease [bacterium]